MRNPILQETKDQCIARLEASGDLDPNCAGCAERYAAPTPERLFAVFAPNHKARKDCAARGVTHCTGSCCGWD